MNSQSIDTLNQSTSVPNKSFGNTQKHVLLSNDDGFSALGIQALAKALVGFGFRVTICAPSEERSGQSHAMTFFKPILVKKVNSFTYSVQGTPADSVAIGLQSILKLDPPDIIVSGINNGLNVGWDVNYSGTVGAATEAALLGYKAIALSLDVDKYHQVSSQGFEKSASFFASELNNLMGLNWPAMSVMNINFPWLEETQKPKGVKHVFAGNYSMYVASVDEMIVQKNDSLKIYMIGGHGRRSNGDTLQDVTLVQDGFVTISFLECKQRGSSISTDLENYINQSLSLKIESAWH
jgi:5'-nucleotidase